ncbi:MAG: efflux RND transporter periplasmic adaptor subunit [Pseudomonadota bacterium]
MHGSPLAPGEVNLVIELERLDGTIDRFSFAPEKDYLAGNAVVAEPHSFDVRVRATYDGRQFNWAFASYEGRTIIDEAIARDAGIIAEPAGPAVLTQTLGVIGRTELGHGAQAVLRARFPGQVLAVDKAVGDRVRSGERLARVENNESLRPYDIVSPIDGVVLERRTNVGDVAGADPVFIVGDLTRLHVDFHIFPKDLQHVASGQPVTVTSIDGHFTAPTRIETFLPAKVAGVQTVIARATLSNPNLTLMPGMTVEGAIVIRQEEVPLAVRTSALQRFRDFTVVFAKVGETYEVRMLELGRQTPEWTEVLGGLRAGQDYVTHNSFLIKADIEKSGASHDH